MESWRNCWRKGVAPELSTPGLEALRAALVSDNPRLIQGATTTPPPLACVQDWPCEGACAITLAGWLGDGHELVGEAEEYFVQACFAIDRRMGECAACQWFLNWFDETPREEMRRELLYEVNLELATRKEMDVE